MLWPYSLKYILTPQIADIVIKAMYGNTDSMKSYLLYDLEKEIDEIKNFKEEPVELIT